MEPANNMKNLGNDYLATRSELLKKLFTEAEQPKRFKVIYQGVRDHKKVNRPYDLLASLGIEKEDLSSTAKEALEAIEELSAQSDDWLDLRWKLSAFLHIQDIFDMVLQPIEDLRILFQQYYFYFESRIILAESVVAGLNGLYIASNALIRPFLEFTLLQNYYYRLVKKIGNYADVQEYFAKGKHPSWGTVIRESLPRDSFCNPIRFRIQRNLAGLSEFTSHPYHPDFSQVQHRTSVHGHSLEGIFFWHMTRMIVDSALWIYYVNFPLLFHPVDVLRKFGYNGPVGVVVDDYTGALIKRSLSKSDYEAFQKYSSNQECTKSVLEWISAQPDLSDDQIRATWKPEDGRLADLWEGYCHHMAKFRVLRMVMAFRKSEVEPLPNELIEATQSLEGWKKLSRWRSSGG